MARSNRRTLIIGVFVFTVVVFLVLFSAGAPRLGIRTLAGKNQSTLISPQDPSKTKPRLRLTQQDKQQQRLEFCNLVNEKWPTGGVGCG